MSVKSYSREIKINTFHPVPSKHILEYSHKGFYYGRKQGICLSHNILVIDETVNIVTIKYHINKKYSTCDAHIYINYWGGNEKYNSPRHLSRMYWYIYFHMLTIG